MSRHKDRTPPPWCTRLLGFLVDPADRDALLGDLHAEFVRRSEDGEAEARRWYRRQAVRSLWDVAARRWIDPTLRARRDQDRRGTGRGAGIEAFARDLRLAARTLSKAPGFTAITVMALGVGIGASSSVFSVVDTLLIRPLAFEAPEKLFMLWETDLERSPGNSNNPSTANFFDWERSSATFERMAAFAPGNAVLTGLDEPLRLDGYRVSADFFTTLGVGAIVGRTPLPEENLAGGERVVVLDHGLWQQRFNGDPGVVGETVTLSGLPHVVVGVMPADFEFPSAAADYWTPLAIDAEEASQRRSHYLSVIARLSPGASVTESRVEMRGISERLAIEYPATDAGKGVLIRPLHDEIVGDVRPVLMAVLGAIVFVLLIACANVANLTLTRAADRHNEVSVRAALGASRVDIAREMFAESLVVAALGGAAGLALASYGVRVLSALVPASLPMSSSVDLDARAVAFTASLALATTLLFGLLPALRASRPNLGRALQDGARSAGSDRGHQRFRAFLVAGEVGLALMLLLAAGLLMRSSMQLANVDPGFNPEGLISMRLDMSSQQYQQLDRRLALYDEVLARTMAMPGTGSAGMITFLPMRFGGGSTFVSAEGGVEVDDSDPVFPVFRIVSPQYLETMRIPVRGRGLDDRDVAGSLPVVVVNEAFATAFWPGQDAVDKRIKNGALDADAPWLTVVGVAGDVRQFAMDAAARPEFYMSYHQSGDRGFFMPNDLVVRVGGDPRARVADIRAVVRNIDADMPLTEVLTGEDIVAASMAPRRFNAVLIGSFAGVALLLAVIGIYGVVSHAVAGRRREIGVRVALGASSPMILRLVLRQGARPIAAGVVLGLAGAIAAGRLIDSLLYEVRAFDGVTFAIVTGILVGAALLAILIPARRSLRVDPVVALRSD